MRAVIRFLLFGLLVASLVYVGILAFGSNPQRIPLIIALLAVVAALVAALPSLRILELQEDAVRPYVVPHLDFSSRYMLLQIRVSNLGQATAYDIRLTWSEHLVDHKGVPITDMDEIHLLLPSASASQLIGTVNDEAKKLEGRLIRGRCRYRDAKGKSFEEPFELSTKGHKKQLTYDDELVKTLRELQHIPEALDKISDSIGDKR